MAKNIIIEKDMQELTSVNYRYNMRLPIIYRYNNLLVIGQTTIEQNKELESMGATIRESDLGHNFLCLRYSKDIFRCPEPYNTAVAAPGKASYQ